MTTEATVRESEMVDLSSYDVILVNTSAGKDSQAMLDLVADLAAEAGVSERVVAVHADLGRVEWEGTRELAEEQVAHYGFRFEVVSRPQGDLLLQVEQRAEAQAKAGKTVNPWPSSQARYCTSDQKTGQVAKLMTQLAREHREAGNEAPVRILNCLGLRAAESPARSKKPEFKHDRAASNGRRHVDTWLPIFDWTAEQVWERIEKAGTRHHRAYDLGMPRLSCVFCVFAPKPVLMVAGKHNRELLDKYVEVEGRVGSKFRNDLAIAEVRDALDRGEEPGQIKTWEM